MAIGVSSTSESLGPVTVGVEGMTGGKKLGFSSQTGKVSDGRERGLTPLSEEWQRTLAERGGRRGPHPRREP